MNVFSLHQLQIRKLFSLSFLFSAAGFAFGVPGQDISKAAPRKPAECVIRGGLPNFFKKCREGKTVSIAYFGGSITEQPGWRVHSMEHFKKLYPKTEFIEIHAAIGGSNSTFGVFRMDLDVLPKKPDLVFVEFSTNDEGNKDLRSTRLAMEGIVRKIWKNNPVCDICFIYTVTAGDIRTLKAGKSKSAVCAMEEIADHYNIPSVDFAPEVCRLVAENKLVMYVKRSEMIAVGGKAINGLAGISRLQDGRIPFSEDGVHPYPDTGHKIYQQVLARSLAKMENCGKDGAHSLKQPMWKDCWEVTKTLAPDDPRIKFAGKHVIRKDSYHEFFPGTTLEFRFKGRKIMLFEELGPESGSISVKINDQPEKIFFLFDKWCSGSRRSYTTIADELDPEKIHSVKITVRNEKFDKRKILFKERQPYYDKNAGLFDEWKMILRSVYIVGEIFK